MAETESKGRLVVDTENKGVYVYYDLNDCVIITGNKKSESITTKDVHQAIRAKLGLPERARTSAPMLNEKQLKALGLSPEAKKKEVMEALMKKAGL